MFITHFQSRYKRHLVLCPSTSIASIELSARVGIINIDNTTQKILPITILRCLHQLMFYLPARRIIVPAVAVV